MNNTNEIVFRRPFPVAISFWRLILVLKWLIMWSALVFFVLFSY